MVPSIGATNGLSLINPVDVAKIFNMRPEDFTAVNAPVDILLGHIRTSIFPAADRMISESRLYCRLFGS